jgi:hypothetical protein
VGADIAAFIVTIAAERGVINLAIFPAAFLAADRLTAPDADKLRRVP